MKCLQCKKPATPIEDELRECESGHRTGIIKMSPPAFQRWQASKRHLKIISKTQGSIFKVPGLIKLEPTGTES